MDIYTRIKTDHDEAKVLMDKIAALGANRHSERVRLMQQLSYAVITHNNAEADTFYVVLEQHRETRGQIAHSREEHDDANSKLLALAKMGMEPAEWERTFAVCRDALLHHIHEEETTVFAKARNVLTANAAMQLGGIMEALKQKKLHFAA